MILTKFEEMKKKFMIILDQVDFIRSDGASFVSAINKLTSSTTKLQIIFSSSFYVEGLHNFKVKSLKTLNNKDSLELFIAKIPHEDKYEPIQEEQIAELHEYTLELIK